MNEIEQLLENNRKWSERTTKVTPDFFASLAKQQSPKFLWIGCSDSRVPANQIVDLPPGEVFVHRNVANLVVHTDFNCLSVLQFAVDVLKVEHVIVCGHYGCGGINAALQSEPLNLGLVDNWLGHIRDIASKHEKELSKLSGAAKSARLCEINVLEQTENVKRNAIVRNAITRGQKLKIHSWVYSLKNGLVTDLSVD
ncbi:carbonate dehydratase [Aliiglaciecola lipolytica]|uniref:Carbonic anhydrase n=1 Tax=Aliiglaciecola lipolytica E3 TaxID=1127673 RepID=K6YYH9_9ALTE|nr:carbonate dehydratase [Aliiglaciecola lipolytica]GAC16280.1 carbonic anhydrase [Aliiglaciecola lipolytica E3]